MSTLTPNYGLIVPEGTDTVEQVRADYATNLNTIDGIGGGGSGGHTIIDPNGTSMAQEAGLQFTGSVTVSDDSVNGKTVVNITGGGGSNLIIDAQIYSDDEKIIGIWRNNKPLYQKTIDLGQFVNNSTKTVAHNIPDIDLSGIAKAEGIIYNANSNYSMPLPRVHDGSTNNQIFYEITATSIVIYSQNLANASNFTGRLTIQYTKTTDVAGSGGYEAYGFSPVIYSETERVIGVWRDNKPLYQKTVNFGSLPANNGSKNVAHGISDLETLVNAIFVVQSSTQYRTLPNVSRGNVSNQTMWYMTATDVYVLAGNNADVGSSFSGYITIQYTKTTDVAGSGDYNTLEVPTVHYSTSEQVIGTWIDGKPLYQKTVPFTASSGGYKNVATGITDFDTIFVQEAFIKYSNGVAVLSSYKPSVDANEFVGLIGSSGSFDYRCGNNLNNGDGSVTLKYTKTTD